MTDYILENWSAKYRAWPRVLIEKFAAEIEIESNRFFPDVRKDLSEFYLQNVKTEYQNVIPQNYGRQDKTFSILNPTNQRFARSVFFDFSYRFPFQFAYTPFGIEFVNYGFNARSATDYVIEVPTSTNNIGQGGFFSLQNYVYMNPFGNLFYDDRLFNVISIEFKQFIRTTGASGYVSDMDIYEYAIIDNQHVAIVVRTNIKQYSQAKSLIALYENGISQPDIDYKKLIEFQTYLDAYEKYKTQIESDYQLQIQKTAADLNQYEQQLIDKFNAEKSALQNLKIQIGVALSNEAASAKRDFLNLFLNTQNLQVNLGRQ